MKNYNEKKIILNSATKILHILSYALFTISINISKISAEIYTNNYNEQYSQFNQTLINELKKGVFKIHPF
jgi:hypothetical protein